MNPQTDAVRRLANEHARLRRIAESRTRDEATAAVDADYAKLAAQQQQQERAKELAREHAKQRRAGDYDKPFKETK